VTYTQAPARSRSRAAALAFSLLGLGLLGDAASARADIAVGTAVENPELRDAADKPAKLPDFGDKVLLVLYTDPDVADQNDAFADAVKAENLDKSRFASLGIANMEDAPAKPNWIIRAIVRSKIKKYNVAILTDPKRLLIQQWQLGDCNDKSVVLVVGKDKKVKFFKKGKLKEDETKTVIELLKKLIADPDGAAD
jgi:hypothetical protein